METIDFETMKKELKKEELKRKLKKPIEMIRNNANVIIPLAAAVSLETSKLIRECMRHHRTNKEIKYKERTIYDHSLGRYVELKRKLTPEQALTIEERRANGEKLHMILNDMNLLKK